MSSSSSCSALSARAVMRVACWMVSVSRPAKSSSDKRDSGLGQPGPHRVGVDVALGGLGEVVGGQIGGDVAVDDHAADRQPQLLQLVDRLERLLDRQRLQQRHQVDGGQVGVQQLDHALGLRVHRTALGEVRDGLGDVEEPGDAAGRRRVDHHRVVDRLLALLVPRRHDLLDLAGEQHVAQAGRDRRRELDGADPPHRPAGDARGCRTCRGIRGTRPRCRWPAR